MSEVAQAGLRGFHQVDEVVWELPAGARADMRVPARVFADRELIGQIATDRSLEQLQNVATLPGITWGGAGDARYPSGLRLSGGWRGRDRAA
jgi:hypothetical protein